MIPCMQKEAKMLLLTGSLVAAGLVVSFLGNALAVEGLMQFEKELDAEEYTVTVDMDSYLNKVFLFNLKTYSAVAIIPNNPIINTATPVVTIDCASEPELLPIATVIGITVS